MFSNPSDETISYIIYSRGLSVGLCLYFVFFKSRQDAASFLEGNIPIPASMFQRKAPEVSPIFSKQSGSKPSQPKQPSLIMNWNLGKCAMGFTISTMDSGNPRVQSRLAIAFHLNSYLREPSLFLFKSDGSIPFLHLLTFQCNPAGRPTKALQ